MTLKEKIQRKIDMVEYYRETNCDKEEFMKKFKTRDNNFFYITRVISRSEKKYDELKVKLDHPRSKYNQLRVQCNSDEVQEWLTNGIKEMISRGKTTKEISKIFNRKEEEIEKLAGDLSVWLYERKNNNWWTN